MDVLEGRDGRSEGGALLYPSQVGLLAHWDPLPTSPESPWLRCRSP